MQAVCTKIYEVQIRNVYLGSDSDEEFDIEEENDRIICKAYGFKNNAMSLITVWRWMQDIV